ncbi:hypothetical protein I105_03727 [Mycobacterium tuberculosis OFXR-2]|nr:hypothetical protein I105_03727 [Mycobacterium tuberculosis OFXR-2]
MTDTLFADVSEYQVPVNNSYPYRVLSIRVCDGTYRDRNFAHNYRWMRSAFDSGRLTFGIVYTYARPNWWANANTVRSMIDAAGGLHPRVALMLDVESGGNPPGDGSSWINRLYWNLADYACGSWSDRLSSSPWCVWESPRQPKWRCVVIWWHNLTTNSAERRTARC